MSDLWKLTGFEISELFKKKEISAVEICNETIKHIEILKKTNLFCRSDQIG